MTKEPIVGRVYKSKNDFYVRVAAVDDGDVCYQNLSKSGAALEHSGWTVEDFNNYYPTLVPPSWTLIPVGVKVRDRNGYKHTILEVGATGKTFLRSGWGDHDKADGWYTATEAQHEGWTFVDAPEIVELTLDQISKKFGVPVEKLKIKKQ